MRAAWFPAAIFLAFALALGLRLVALDARPMHHDEANQAVKFGALLESGDYRYDPDDHHGPSLYYLTLPAAWLRGQHTLAQLDAGTLRGVTAVFGAGLILLLPLIAPGIGRAAAAAAALFIAISPALTYYSRFYIQESVFAFFGIGFLAALGRYAGAGEPRWRRLWAVAAGLFAGLAYATKETSIIVVGSAVVAWAVAASLVRGARVRVAWKDLLLAGGVAAAVAVSLYSSFFRYPGGPLESVLAFATYFERGVGSARHAHPAGYYLRILGGSASGGLVWTEAAILVLALAGAAFAARRARASFWPLYVAIYSAVAALVFSLLTYKTPWNLVPFHAGFAILAGIGVTALWTVVRPAWGRAILVALLAAAVWNLGAQNARANRRYPADPRNPYAYAQTSPDFLRLSERIHQLARVHPDGRGMLVKVVAGPYEQWPLPWYLRDMTRVGYWARAGEAEPLDEAAVVVASQETGADVEAVLGHRYVSEFYGLRPDVLLTVFIDADLWGQVLHIGILR
jgi:uncharacterized protein (TIGR03663 family)